MKGLYAPLLLVALAGPAFSAYTAVTYNSSRNQLEEQLTEQNVPLQGRLERLTEFDKTQRGLACVGLLAAVLIAPAYCSRFGQEEQERRNREIQRSFRLASLGYLR